MMKVLRLGLLINPFAGIGGTLALKGSDSEATVKCALAHPNICQANQRVRVALEQLLPLTASLHWLCAPGVMGEDILRATGFVPQVVGQLMTTDGLTSAADTERLAQQLMAEKVDLLLFAGGDGAARNIVNVVDTQQLCLGIPAGVKMHSGVYAISPQAAARVVEQLAAHKPTSVGLQEVRDIDEEQLRQGRVQASYYGELLTLDDNRYVQRVKSSGNLDESALQADIAAALIDDMDHETLYLIGPGTTPKTIMDELVLPNTLLGIDAVFDRQQVASDLTEQGILELLERYRHYKVKVCLTATGQQGHLIGRGNQPLSASVLKRIGRRHILPMITPGKLAALEGRPLLMDSGDIQLDQEWTGQLSLLVGYREWASYPLFGGGQMTE